MNETILTILFMFSMVVLHLCDTARRSDRCVHIVKIRGTYQRITYHVWRQITATRVDMITERRIIWQRYFKTPHSYDFSKYCIYKKLNASNINDNIWIGIFSLTYLSQG